MTELCDGERIDYVNDNISLIQKPDGLTFGTDALLLAGYIDGKYGLATELGGGSGIISMLVASRNKVSRVDCVEIQEEYAELISRNCELNGLQGRMNSVCSDIRDYNPKEESEVVFTNPPYMKSDSGKNNSCDKKSIARHEIHGSIDDFCQSAARLLKFGGDFYAVYRPDRMADIIASMKLNGIEPKRLTLVYANCNSKPSMLLIKGKRGAKSSMTLTKPFFIYKDGSNKDYSSDMNYVMENGFFPKEYK